MHHNFCRTSDEWSTFLVHLANRVLKFRNMSLTSQCNWARKMDRMVLSQPLLITINYSVNKINNYTQDYFASATSNVSVVVDAWNQRTQSSRSLCRHSTNSLHCRPTTITASSTDEYWGWELIAVNTTGVHYWRRRPYMEQWKYIIR